jgi:hypothetical protein
MKAKIINQKIKIGLPKYYKHWAGGFDSLSDEIHEQEGFFPIVSPTFDSTTQQLGSIYFDEGQKIFTYPVIDKVFDIQKIKDQKLKTVDYEIEKELGLIAVLEVLDLLINEKPIPAALKLKFSTLIQKRLNQRQQIEQAELTELLGISSKTTKQ